MAARAPKSQEPTPPPTPALPAEAQEILRLIATRGMIMRDKLHRVYMSTFDAEQSLRDLSVEDEDLETLIEIMRIDIGEIRRDIDRIGHLGEKVKGLIGPEAWLKRQLEGLGERGGS